MVALDVLEQLDAGPLELIAAHARKDRIPHGVEVAVEKVVREVSHSEPGDIAMLKENDAAAHDGDRSVELVALTTESRELSPCSHAIRRLGKPTITQRQGLVRSEHQAAELAGGNCLGLLAGEQRCHPACVPDERALLDAALIDIRWCNLDRNTGVAQQCVSDSASRRENERMIVEPKRHIHATECRRRSVRRLSTAAAVSSIERRVTSMLGQL